MIVIGEALFLVFAQHEIDGNADPHAHRLAFILRWLKGNAFYCCHGGLRQAGISSVISQYLYFANLTFLGDKRMDKNYALNTRFPGFIGVDHVLPSGRIPADGLGRLVEGDESYNWFRVRFGRDCGSWGL